MLEEPRWVLLARTDDRPGALADLTGVFSTRGVNVDAVVAVRGAGDGQHGPVLAVFRSAERRARLLHRTVARLDAVRSTELRLHDGTPLAAALENLRQTVATTTG